MQLSNQQYIADVGVRHAIEKGLKLTTQAKRLTIGVSILLFFAMAFAGFGLLAFLLPIIATVAAAIYTTVVVQRWRIWAYKNVADIHQLQRSSELAGLLSLHSYDKPSFWTDDNEITVLLQRFEEEHYFVDDFSYPRQVPIHQKGFFTNKLNYMTISRTGIAFLGGDMFKWQEISEERIVSISTTHDYFDHLGFRHTRDATSSTKVLRFMHQDDLHEIPLSWLRIAPWELDLILYIYRGRYEMRLEEG